MKPHERILFIVEAYMAAYGGWRKLRNIKNLLLIEAATAAGAGIGISELARASDTPLESVRRQVHRHVRAGRLSPAPDPGDRRVVRYFVTPSGIASWRTRELAARLGERLGTAPGQMPPPDAPPLDALLSLIDTIIDGYMGSIRIRGASMALLVYQATLDRTGVSISDLARIHKAPRETVRRIMIQHSEMGHVRFTGDPADDRRTLVVTADLASETIRIAEMDRRVDRVDWQRFGSARIPQPVAVEGLPAG